MSNKYPENDYAESMAKRGLTPEQARDLAVKMLLEVNFSERALAPLRKPLERLNCVEWELVQEITRRPEELKDWAKTVDLSDFAKASNFITYLTTD